MRPHRRLRPFVGESEAAALVERYALGTWQRAASELAYGCCLDGAALAALVLDDLDLDGGWVTSRGVARPLGRLAREAVTAYLASGGGPRRGGRSILPSLRHVKAAVPARLLAFSAAVHMVRRGADVVTVGVLLGYTSPGSASRALGAFSVTARDIPSTWRKRG
jgi:site-specific recombinase XerC